MRGQQGGRLICQAGFSSLVGAVGPGSAAVRSMFGIFWSSTSARTPQAPESDSLGPDQGSSALQGGHGHGTSPSDFLGPASVPWRWLRLRDQICRVPEASQDQE